jgi:DMSO/TMAO reductase YedYZ molybdopterin-dependent catalytic subunit
VPPHVIATQVAVCRVQQTCRCETKLMLHGIEDPAGTFPVVGDGTMIESDPRFHLEELQLAFRNKAMPLEALRYDVTPTGMHYSLTHYDIPGVQVENWKLTVDGMVTRPRSFSFPELVAMPSVSRAVTLECAGDGRALTSPRPISQPWLAGAVGTADWAGIPLRTVLEMAEIDSATRDVVFSGLDEGYEGGIRQTYQRSLPLSDALSDGPMLALRMNGQPLEPQHGFPMRLIVPGWYGMASVKWLARITALGKPFDGYQQNAAYRYTESRDQPGEPVTTMRPRALLLPPGVPDFLTRTRVVDAGPVLIEGRAGLHARSLLSKSASTGDRPGKRLRSSRLMTGTRGRSGDGCGRHNQAPTL